MEEASSRQQRQRRRPPLVPLATAAAAAALTLLAAAAGTVVAASRSAAAATSTAGFLPPLRHSSTTKHCSSYPLLPLSQVPPRTAAPLPLFAAGGGSGGGKGGKGGGTSKRGGGGKEGKEDIRAAWASNFGKPPPRSSMEEEGAFGGGKSSSSPKNKKMGGGEKGGKAQGRVGGREPRQPSVVPSSSGGKGGAAKGPSAAVLKKMTKGGRQNPVLKLVLAKHPELVDKSIEELEAELDAKFDRTIRNKGLEYYYAEEDEEERARAEARLAPMATGGAVREGVVMRKAPTLDSEDEELSEQEMLALGLELDGGEEEEMADDDEEDENTIVVVDDSEDDEQTDPAPIPTEPKGFKLRPPPQTQTPSPVANAAAGGSGREKGGSKQQRGGREDREEEFWDGDLEEEEEIRPPTGPAREGGDLRFRRSNLFALHNVKPDASVLVGGESFASLGVRNEHFLANLQKMGLSTPTRIQAAAVPALLRGREAILHSYTGSGKTLAYLLPLLSRVNPAEQHVQLLVLAPSRELAAQIASVATELTEGTGISVLSLIGGASLQRQVEHLRWDKPQVLIGTPGRVAEMVLEKRKARLGRTHMLVLDEVDMLLDDSYYGDVRMIVQSMGGLRQAVFASATGAAPDVRGLAGSVMEEGFVTIDSSYEEKEEEAVVDAADAASEGDREGGGGGGAAAAPEGVKDEGNGLEIELPASLRHGIFITPPAKLEDGLRRFLNTEPAPERVMVFANDALKIRQIVDRLAEKGIAVAGLHGDVGKQERAAVLSKFMAGKLRVLVTTEVAARGIDVPSLTHVVNLDVPSSMEQYVHRAGRAGRAGRPGIVLSLSPPSTAYILDKFAKRLRIKLERVDIAHGRVIRYDVEDLPDAQPKPSRAVQRRMQRQQKMQGLKEGQGGGEEE